MKRSPFLAAVVAALACVAVTGTHATAVVNHAPDQVYGTNMSFALVADDFTLASSASITSLRFWTLQSSAADYAGSVYWAIYSGATPTTLLQSGTASPSGALTGASSGFGYDEFVYDIPVTFDLGAGTYWLALQNAALGNDDPTEMIWGSSGTGGDPGLYKDFTLSPTPDWLGADFNHAFAIVTDDSEPPDPNRTPVPGTLALVFAGGLGLRTVQRTRRAA